MNKNLLSYRELIAAQLPKQVNSFLDEKLKISKSRDPFTIYVQYRNPGTLPNKEFNVLVTVGYKKKGDKKWKSEQATLIGAPGKLLQDRNGELQTALDKINLYVGAEFNTTDYFTKITDTIAPLNDIRLYVEDNKAYRQQTAARQKKIQAIKIKQKQKQKQKQIQEKKKPENITAKPQQTQKNRQDKENDAEFIREDFTFDLNSPYSIKINSSLGEFIQTNDIARKKNLSMQDVNSNKTDIDIRQKMTPGKEFVYIGTERDNNIDYLTFVDDNRRTLSITKNLANIIFNPPREDSDKILKELKDSYNDYVVARSSVAKKTPDDYKNIYKTIGEELYNTFIPYKIVNSISLDPDEWWSIQNKKAVIKAFPHFAPMLQDKDSYNKALIILKDFRKKINTPQGLNTEDPKDAQLLKDVQAFNLHEIFDDVYDYLDSNPQYKTKGMVLGGPKNIKQPDVNNKSEQKDKPNVSQVTKQKNIATIPTNNKNKTITEDKGKRAAELDDEEIIKKYSNIIFRDK